MNSKSLGDIADYRNRWVFLPSFDPAQIPHIYSGLGGELLLTEPLSRPQTFDIGSDDPFPPHFLMGWQSRPCV